MKTYTEINAAIKRIVKQVADQQGIEVGEIEDHHAVVDDLHFASLDVATLTSLFKRELGVNPFMMGIAAITEIRTIKEISEVYQRALEIQENPNMGSQKIDTEGRSERRKSARKRHRNDET